MVEVYLMPNMSFSHQQLSLLECNYALNHVGSNDWGPRERSLSLCNFFQDDAFHEGLPELAIASILRDVLKALQHLHSQVHQLIPNDLGTIWETKNCASIDEVMRKFLGPGSMSIEKNKAWLSEFMLGAGSLVYTEFCLFYVGKAIKTFGGPWSSVNFI